MLEKLIELVMYADMKLFFRWHQICLRHFWDQKPLKRVGNLFVENYFRQRVLLTSSFMFSVILTCSQLETFWKRHSIEKKVNFLSFMWCIFLSWIFYALRVVYYRDLRQDDAILHARYMAFNIFGTILVNNLTFSFSLMFNSFRFVLFDFGISSVCQTNLNTINENKHDSRRYVITRQTGASFTRFLHISSFSHCLHTFVTMLLWFTYL